MFGLPDQAFGAIVAAVIAGIVALLGLIISKESKVSEFRQQWIDALRADIAAVIRYGHSMYSRTSFSSEQQGGQHPWDMIRQDFAALTEAMARIRLRLNNKEQESAALLAALNKHAAAVKRGVTNDDARDELNVEKAITSASDELVAAANVVLKQEWNRVRSGERVYRVARWIALIIIGCGIVWGLALLLHFKK